jgi:hypothetical protein
MCSCKGHGVSGLHKGESKAASTREKADYRRAGRTSGNSEDDDLRLGTRLGDPRKPNNGWPASARRKGTLSMQAKYRALRHAAYEDALLFYLHLSEVPGFRDFLVLFITEGHRRSRHRVSIANSDPAVVQLATRWMRVFSASPLTFSVQYHADQKLAEIQAFWSTLLGVAPDDIRLQRKSNSGQLVGRSWRSEHGVLTVTADDTYFREALQAWTDCLRDTWLDST